MPGWAFVIGVFALGHPLPDGHIERAIQVQVYPARVEIRYYLGINGNTVGARWKQASPGAAVPADPEEALVQYCTGLSPKLGRRITVTVNGEKRPVRSARCSRIFKHHIQFECVYHIDIEAGETPQKLAIIDGNFRETPGSHRMALKGRDGVYVLDTTAPAILARVQRIPWDEMTDEQREMATHIEGMFVRPTPP